MKYLTHFYDEIKYTEKIYYYQSKCLHGCFHYVWYRKKTIWQSGLSRSPGNKFLRSFERKCEYCIFLWELYSFYKKVPSALDHAYFFSKYFTAPNPLQPSCYFLQIFVDIQNYANKINYSFTKKAWKFVIKTERLKHRNFSWSYQRNRTPSAKHLWQTPCFRLRLSEVTESEGWEVKGSDPVRESF